MATTLNLCFTKIKRSQFNPPSLSQLMNTEDHTRPVSSTSTSTNSGLIKNFNSLYDSNSNSNSLTGISSDPDQPVSESDSNSEPDFATVIASQRFFFNSPGRSNSIVESSPSIASSSSTRDDGVINTDQSSSDLLSGSNNGEDLTGSASVKDSVAVPTYSPDPYMDFRRSMQEMVDARGLHDVKANWEYLHELLLCYLTLNPRSTHKYIIGAFADLLVTLISSSPSRSPEGKMGI